MICRKNMRIDLKTKHFNSNCIKLARLQLPATSLDTTWAGMIYLCDTNVSYLCVY